MLALVILAVLHKALCSVSPTAAASLAWAVVLGQQRLARDEFARQPLRAFQAKLRPPTHVSFAQPEPARLCRNESPSSNYSQHRQFLRIVTGRLKTFTI
ncbi:hypothetical protein C2W62_50055 [Candidatus Entotheonella serta]|nr:hypothetical protein C2W62_50055 [Candidatus Entotheonella serta]